jgi:DNA polymerase elongation subunit (family B)
MISLEKQNKLNKIKSQCLVFDIETSALDANGIPIDIKKDFEGYVEHAQVKWIGFYSYKTNKSYLLNVYKDMMLIKSLLSDHKYLIGFNSEEFDFPIVKNNGLDDPNNYYVHVDVMQILGRANFKNRRGYKLKDRATLMGYKLKSNSLENMAKTFNLEFQKGDIDYSIFHKNEWNEQETADIKEYLFRDIMVTKGLFDILWNYWMPFVEMIDDKSIEDLSWIRRSVASLTYLSICHSIGVDPTYGEKDSSQKENMGGHVYLPKYEEVENVYYCDVNSLYPNIQVMFNLFNETDETSGDNIWHGNELFKSKGYYNNSFHHPACITIAQRLKERMDLKANDEENPMVYTLKIWLNSLYGASRSAIFERIHTPNIGWDTCYLGQQIQAFIDEMLTQFGCEIVYGDTDSLIIIVKDKENDNLEFVQGCLDEIISIINDNVPFPVDTFGIKIEQKCDYMLFPFKEDELVDEETRKLLNKKIIDGYEEKVIDKKKCIIETASQKVVKKGRSWVKQRVCLKKNYIYVYEKDGETKVKIVGLPIKKEGSTKLGMLIFEEVLEPLIIKNKRAKFSNKFIDETINEYLKREDIMQLMSREFKIKPAESYKLDSSIYAQISNAYLNGGGGIIRLIKNNKVGKAGKGMVYCTVKEAKEANLGVDNLDLEKTINELSPFIEYEGEK